MGRGGADGVTGWGAGRAFTGGRSRRMFFGRFTTSTGVSEGSPRSSFPATRSTTAKNRRCRIKEAMMNRVT
jgi:hypothetical protein